MDEESRIAGRRPPKKDLRTMKEEKIISGANWEQSGLESAMPDRQSIEAKEEQK